MSDQSDTIVISLNQLRPGVVLPSPIYDGKNPDLLLLGEGIRVTQRNVDRLFERGVRSIAVDAAFADQLSKRAGSNSKPPSRNRAKDYSKLREKDRAQAQSRAPLIQQLKTPETLEYSEQVVEDMQKRRCEKSISLNYLFEKSADHRLRDGSAVKGVAVESIKDMMLDMDLFVKLAIDTDDNNDDQSHCVRVSELAMAVAAVMEYPQKKIEELGMGCLLYRAAMTSKAERLRQESRHLSRAEHLEITKNPKMMFEALSDISDIPVGARQVAYQICERWDGSGYPRRRAGNQIHPLARIASVCDVYVALTSHRPHRPAFEPYKAVEQILEETKNHKFDPAVIRAFLKTVCLYPLGSYVELDNGHIGIVVRTNLEHFDRPVITILLDENGKMVTHQTIDLAQEPTRSVVKAIEKDVVEVMLVTAKSGRVPEKETDYTIA